MTLYSTPGCPMCQMLAQKLSEKKIPFEKNMDVAEMKKKGIQHVPVLETKDGKMLSMREAMEYIGNLAPEETCESCEVN